MSIFLRPQHKGTEEEMVRDPMWNGVPPVGRNPITNRYRFLGLVLVVFMVKITIWTVYRWMTGNIYPLTEPRVEDWVSLIAKPALQLGPVFLLWWFLFKEKGIPFRLTRVNLFSSVIWGCLGGLAFYIVASLIYVGQMNFFGFGTDFNIVSGFDIVGWGGVISLLFTYMLSTGPAEEMFSRGFIQDQIARGYPLAHAIIISSLLFAVGHLPISIMVHHLTFTEIFWYMCTLVLMGGFFSIIYQMSRNIVLVIIIHGLWDWYLTMFAVRGAYDFNFMADYGVNFGRADFINTMLTIMIMLPFFWVLYRVFWRRLWTGDRPGFEEKIRDFPVVRMVRERDRGEWPSKPWRATMAIVGVFCLLMIPISAVIGTNDPMEQVDRITEDSLPPVSVFSVQTLDYEGLLNERDVDTRTLSAQGTIFMVNVTLTWTDEAPARIGFVNTPDTFTLKILGSLQGEMEQMTGDSGSLEINWEMDPRESNETVTIEVELSEAGDHVGRIGLRTIPDDSNSFKVDVTYHVVRYEKGTGGSDDVRW